MQLRKRSVVYSGVVIALALTLSAGLLQLTQFGAQSAVQAKPLAQLPLQEFSLTVVKDAVPDSTQPFTFVVGTEMGGDFAPEGYIFELIDDGTDISNTWTVTGPASVSPVILYEAMTDGWLPTDVRCQDETGTVVRGWAIDGLGAFILLDVEGGRQYTCTFTNGAPAITLDKTVGTDPAVCAISDEITVLEGTAVDYCYTVTNTGGLPLIIHGLEDDQLGTLLDGFNYTLAPNASTLVTQTVTPPVTTTNVATWTALVTYVSYFDFPVAGPFSIQSSDYVLPRVAYSFTAVVTDTAKVNVEPLAPSIAVTKTVGTEDGVCAATDEITVAEGTTVYYCYTVENTGNVALPLHDLADSELGTIFTGLNYMLTPGSSVNTVAAGLTISATLDVTTTNVATWTAYVVEGPLASAVDSATVKVILNAPSIAVTKTVGTEDGVCAATDEITVAEGTTVYYCYTVENTGNVALPLHDLADSELGAIFSGFNYVLAPGSSVDTVAAGLTISATLDVTTTNVATWTAYVVEGPLASAVDSATVNVIPNAPSIAVTKTVGTADGVCATTGAIEVDAGTTVYYCYTVENTGNVDLPLHDLVDSELGTIFTGLPYALMPGSSVNTVAAGVTVSVTLDVATTNVATWTAYVDDSVTAQSVSAVDSAIVTLAPTDIDTDDQPGKLFLPQIGK